MTINAIVWGENVHEQTNKVVARLYPDGMHGAIAAALNASGGINATTATLQEPEHGLSESRLADTGVLLWWGHAAHGDVADILRFELRGSENIDDLVAAQIKALIASEDTCSWLF
jgi:trehalose utilization protein